MTKEITDILEACKTVRQEGRKAALATVVHVEGSSYRRPGARMLVEDNGRMTGAISGGCLEGDALRKALQAINLGQNRLVTYNTLDDEDLEFGVQLGCNGIVHILFEPILPGMSDPIRLLEMMVRGQRAGVLVTLFSLKDYHGYQPGTCYGFDGESLLGASALEKTKFPGIAADAAGVLDRKSSLIKHLDAGLMAFFEYLPLPVSFVIAGAGNDVFPMVEMTAVLGWQTTVIDGRSTHANRRRFPAVHRVLVARPEEIPAAIGFTDRTVFLLMTHNYNYDLELLKVLLKQNCRYIGSLGPRKRLLRMFGDLEAAGMPVTEEQKNCIFGPAGLDIGAETAEEIALSILAEVKAVMENRPGTSLRQKTEPIHAASNHHYGSSSQ